MGKYHFNRAALFSLMFLCIVRLAGGETYYVQDLGTLGGRTSKAFALNNLGQVVGYADITGNMYSHAVLFSGTGTNNIDLDARGGTNTVGEGTGINDSGQIIGWGQPLKGGQVEALYYTASTNLPLGDLCSSGVTAGSGYAINNSGVMIGFADDCYSTPQPVRFGGTGTPSNVALGGNSGGVAYGINSSGVVVGQSGQLSHAAIFSGSGVTDLGILGGTFNPNGTANSLAFGINDAGQIVGTCTISNGSAFRATLFSGNGSNNISLGTLGGSLSHAYAINNLGEIVGNSYPATNNNSVFHAFIYKNGVMADINGLLLTNAGFSNIRCADTGGISPGKCINDAGQIAAIGELNGLTHAVLLTPILRKTSVGIAGQNVVVTFNAIAGKTYHLQQTTDLANPNWQSVPGVADVTATVTGPAQFTQTNGVSNGKAYYRVQLL